MDQDDKVSAAALAHGSSTSSVRTIRANGGHDRELMSAVADETHSESALHSDAPSRGVDSEASELADDALDGKSEPAAKSASGKTPQKTKNNVRKIRIERMMSKAELARRANLSVLTIDRVERGYGCRMDTKRKILEALGLNLADRVRVFGEEE